MSSVFKVLFKDIEELRHRPNLLLWLVLVCVLFLLVVGNLRAHDTSFRVLIVNSEDEKKDTAVERLLKEFSNVVIVRDNNRQHDLPTSMQLKSAGIAVAWQGKWVVYNGVRPGPQQVRAQQLAYELALSLRAAKPWPVLLLSSLYTKTEALPTPPPSPPPQPTENLPGVQAPIVAPEATAPESPPDYFAETEGAESSSEEEALQKGDPISVVALYGGKLASTQWLVPVFIALVIVFVPFLLACNSIAREQELNTLGALLVTPGLTWLRLALGKALLPILTGFVILVVLLIFTQSWYGLPVRRGVGSILVLELMAIVASTILGLLTASVIRNQLQGYFASAAYLLASILMTGLFFPRAEAAEFVQTISVFLPLSWAYESLANWLLAGNTSAELQRAFLVLGTQISVFAVLSAIGLTLAHRRL